MSDLTEALDRGYRDWTYGDDLNKIDLSALDAIIAAAAELEDLLANGERVWWCEEHGHPSSGDVIRDVESSMHWPTPCLMVQRLLVEPGEET